jgi:hypothetical protein
MHKKHMASAKYNSEYTEYIISTEAVLCASSLALTPGFAPLICTQFSKDIIQLGKQTLIAYDFINDTGLLAKTIDETTETLAFCGSFHTFGGFAYHGWAKVGLKTLAGLTHKFADEWYNIANDYYKGVDILAYTATYTTQYSIQEILQNNMLSVLPNTDARIVSHSTARAIGSMLRDYYNDETIKLEHFLNGFMKGTLYGSKVFFHFFEPYTLVAPAHYLEGILIEDIGVYSNSILHGYADISQGSNVH